MSDDSGFRPMTGAESAQRRNTEGARLTVRQLEALAARGLVRMFDPEKQLFCRQLKRTESGLTREGISRRYTVIALLGLHELEANGTISPIEIRPVLNGLLENRDWVGNVGDLGLLVWLCALEAPERLAEVESHLKLESALDDFRDGRQCSTMELAWFLSGLSHRTLVFPQKESDLRDVAVEAYRRLRNNQGELGIFGHTGKKESVAGILRGHIGSFADQVYPIYAMTRFAQAFRVPKATERALDCALTLCEAQGPLGQWWWHYDSWNGRVVERYPVYSVHQDGMAPMALFALGEAIRSDFSPWIRKGLQWISGENEMDFDMCDASSNVVWQSIFRSSSQRYWNTAVALLIQREDRESQDGLTVLFECSPHHLGWMLYALAGRRNRFSSVPAGPPISII